jgi:endoribonuclease Dicer
LLCLYLHVFFEFLSVGKVAGTKKNKRTHEIVHPPQLINCHPKVTETSYLYIIRMEAKFKPSDENQTVFQQLISGCNDFAILTVKKLPKLAKMSFFVSLGKVEVEIVNRPIEMKLYEEQQLVLLRNYHSMVFRDILGIWKEFFCSTADSYLIVPTKQGVDIDWEMVQNFQNLQQPRERNEIERRKMKFNKPEDYLHKVITPWYRLEQEKQYVVTKVHELVTPFSPFPNSSYATYADYYLDKYQKKIVVQEQFLIEVKGITTYLNLLTPGEGEAGRAKKYNEWMNTEIYIPELCHNYTFPADLWLKATLLPSTLHRLHYLLLAENLRVVFAKHIGIGNENVDPEPLETEKYVINKMFKKNDSKTSFYISNYQAAMGGDSDDSDGGYRKQNRSIVYPNPEETVARPIDPTLKSLCDGVQRMWVADEEPIDLERNWENVYPIEIQHYIKFLAREFNDPSDVNSADSRITCKSGGSARYHQPPRDAICDDPDKYDIKLLYKDSNNSIYSNFNLQQKDVLKAITTAGTDVFDMERYEVLGN